MSTAIFNDQLEVLASESWKQRKDIKFSDDVLNFVINIFNQGKEAGRNEALEVKEKLILKSVQENLDSAFKLSAKFFEEIKNHFDIKEMRLFLGIVNATTFKTIFIIPEYVFSSEAYDEMVRMAYSFEREQKSDTFQYNISFVPQRKSLNLSTITSDYNFEFVGES